MEIGRIIVQSEDGRKEMFQFDSMEEARELLARFQQANPEIAVGFAQESRRNFGG